jgi:hypothetical protein
MGRGGNLLYGDITQNTLGGDPGYPNLADLFPGNENLSQLELDLVDNLITGISYQSDLNTSIGYKKDMIALWHREGIRRNKTQIGNPLWQVNITESKFKKMLAEKNYEARQAEVVIPSNSNDKILTSAKKRNSENNGWIKVAFPEQLADVVENKLAISDHPGNRLSEYHPLRGYGLVDFNHLLSVEMLTKQAFKKIDNMQWFFSPETNRLYYCEQDKPKVYGSVLVVD